MKARASSPSHHKNHKWPERRAAAQSLERFACGVGLCKLERHFPHTKHVVVLVIVVVYRGRFRFLPLPSSISRCDDPHPHPGHVQGQEHAAQHHRAKTSSLTKQGHVWSHRRPPPLSASYLLSAPCFRAIAPFQAVACSSPLSQCWVLNVSAFLAARCWRPRRPLTDLSAFLDSCCLRLRPDLLLFCLHAGADSWLSGASAR